MRIIVTWGAGFIGSHIVDACVARGDEVCVIGNLTTGSLHNIQTLIDLGKVQFYQADISDQQAIYTLFSQFRPDVVFHLAAQINVRKGIEEPLFDAEQNICWSLSLFDAMQRVGCRKIIFSSTGGALFSQGNLPYQESDSPSPSTPYGIAKLTIEQYLWFYATKHHFQSTILRYANVYGPRQNPQGEAGVVTVFIEKIRQGVAPTIFWDGTQTRDFIHVSDVVKANMHVLENSIFGTYHVGLGKEIAINTLWNTLANFTHTWLCPVYAPALGEIQRSALNSDALRKTGWAPSISLDQGIASMLGSL